MGIRDYMFWIVVNWNSQLDLSTYPGSSSPGNRVGVEPVVQTAVIIQQILAGMISGSFWLLDSFTHMRDAMNLVTYGLHSTMEFMLLL